MGAWGEGPFDNDDAADWVYDLEVAEDLGFVRDVLQSVANADGYLEAPEGCVGIAAAEVVATADGHPVAALPEPVSTWVAARVDLVSADDRMLALAAIDRILDTDSELPELWRETGNDAFTEGVENLRRRLATP